MTSISSRLAAAATAYVRHRGGNVAITFAIVLVPLLAMIGAAIDYARANHARSAMQAALDATALMLSKEAANLNTTQLAAAAQAYFNALYSRPEAPKIAFTAEYTAQTTGGGSSVVLTASGSLQTDFMKLGGVPNIDFNVSSTAKWGITRLRVAMALDNTGSMASANKMNALKTASIALVNKFRGWAKNSGDIMVSIVPFAKDVNVGTSNVNAAWLKWNGQSDTWDERNGTCKNYSSWNMPTNKTSCQSQGGSWTPANHNTWTGCVTDRDQSNDTTSIVPSPLLTPTLFPAEQYDACPIELTPLTDVLSGSTTLINQINKMQPSGNTNQVIGLAWAWLSLLNQSPLNAPLKDPNYIYNDVIILLSDGDNTQNRTSSNVSSIDARQRLLCDNIVPSGTAPAPMLFTIQVDTDGTANSSVMQYCGKSGFQRTTTGSGISDAFDKIATSLSKLRIAQ
ncbi:pilus assembly protein [Bradyrhizobium sp. U87765 SZCCT0131]|uniref:TadE/TadG family type IV pilus assembly protein n=1 Tax=unclassified Bradyrhizobium TaxID=2631580 RepID=UPI001BA75812|nr:MULTISPECIES: TadE/TadG family type IV pilus assembly protein [unclassified Bradyrhizobium]MBR1223241.1 pilus assembly protein [Bradyrhizobium sp. U87765 SZCCT0131]MBR1265789.1 pilus assembly protein [Bradyrhizobium sp. U87765 SZCCT0134]MBR1309240.1 pilus assembly protein [Bradyrhizobium sp. U87765 SZCCT0110]MBR1323181.1 pilus assembly protein [Bradyrhizobium sp. U87765 SZCCT0109]MBR1352466.1 pilus assembly protein [Bradyrhizobium sp. U87765 SZCCT0048]